MENSLFVDLAKMAIFINQKTGVPVNIVLEVLDAEMEYLLREGIAE